MVRVVVLHNANCPSTDDTLERIALVADELGIADDLDVETVLVTDDESAAALGFAGSPTVLVEGADVAPSERDLASGAVPYDVCRIYTRADGRPSPLPPVEALRSAMTARERDPAP